MDAADESVDAHEVIHMGMADEECGERLHDTFCQVMDSSAIQQNAPSQGSYEEIENRVVQKAGEKGRLKRAKWQAAWHGISPVAGIAARLRLVFTVFSIFPGKRAKGKVAGYPATVSSPP